MADLGRSGEGRGARSALFAFLMAVMLGVGRAEPDRLAARCDYVGIFRREPRFRKSRQPPTVTITAVLWVAVIVVALYLLAFFLERGFLL